MSNLDTYGNIKAKPMNFDWLSNLAKEHFHEDVLHSVIRIIDDSIRGLGDSSLHQSTLLSLVLSTKPVNILELGCRDGRSTYSLLVGCHLLNLYGIKSKVTSVDIEDTTFQCPSYLEGNWNFIKNDAIDFLKSQSHGYDLIMIDDWHSSEHVYNELTLLKPFITNKTIILLHDLMHSDSTPEYNTTEFTSGEFKGTGPWGGVNKFLQETKSNEYELCTIPVNHGLTIMRKI